MLRFVTEKVKKIDKKNFQNLKKKRKKAFFGEKFVVKPVIPEGGLFFFFLGPESTKNGFMCVF